MNDPTTEPANPADPARTVLAVVGAPDGWTLYGTVGGVDVHTGPTTATAAGDRLRAALPDLFADEPAVISDERLVSTLAAEFRAGATTTDPRAALIDTPPRAVRAPYTVPDRTHDHLQATDVDAWRIARRAARYVALVEPLDGLPLTEHEQRFLQHRAGDDVGEVGTLVALLWRARQAAPAPADPRTWSTSGPA